MRHITLERRKAFNSYGAYGVCEIEDQNLEVMVQVQYQNLLKFWEF